MYIKQIIYIYITNHVSVWSDIHDFKFLIRKKMSQGKFFTVYESKRTWWCHHIVIHSYGWTHLTGSQWPILSGCSVLRTQRSNSLCMWVKSSKLGKNEKLWFQMVGLIQLKQTLMGARDTPKALRWVVSRMQREGRSPGGLWFGMEVGVATNYPAPTLCRLCPQLLNSKELGLLCYCYFINEKTDMKRTVTLCLPWASTWAIVQGTGDGLMKQTGVSPVLTGAFHVQGGETDLTR